MISDYIIQGNTLQRYCGTSTTIIIPNGIKTISENCFKELAITSVALPTSIEYISNSAFEGCTYLTEINFPVSLKNIGKRAFANCINLQIISFDAKLKSIGSEAFYGCKSLKKFKIGSSLSIPYGTFTGCYFDKFEIFNEESPLHISQRNEFNNVYPSIYGKKLVLYEGITSFCNNHYIESGEYDKPDRQYWRFLFEELYTPSTIQYIGYAEDTFSFKKIFFKDKFDHSRFNELSDTLVNRKLFNFSIYKGSDGGKFYCNYQWNDIKTIEYYGLDIADKEAIDTKIKEAILVKTREKNGLCPKCGRKLTIKSFWDSNQKCKNCGYQTIRKTK